MFTKLPEEWPLRKKLIQRLVDLSGMPPFVYVLVVADKLRRAWRSRSEKE